MRNFSELVLEVSLGGSEAFVTPGFSLESVSITKKRNFERCLALGLSWGVMQLYHKSFLKKSLIYRFFKVRMDFVITSMI